MYIVVEGVDGSGKTTVAGSLVRRIERHTGKKPLLLTEPQSEPGTIGHEIRRRMSEGPPVEPWEAVGLFQADRMQQLATKLRPALDAGRVVVQDRSWLSTAVYNADWSTQKRQWINDVVWPGFEFLTHLNRHAMPSADMTIMLNVKGVVAVARLVQRALRERAHVQIMEPTLDRLDAWGNRYRHITDTHLEADGWWGKLVRIDAGAPTKQVCAAAWVAVAAEIERRRSLVA